MTERVVFVGRADDAARIRALAPGVTVDHLDADAAAQRVARREVALLIFGFGKPWLDNLDGLVRLQIAAARHPLKTLALVPRDDPAGLEQAFQLGVADCAGWPIDDHEVRARITMLLRRYRAAERRRAEASADRRRADTDALTGLGNRHLLEASLAGSIARARLRGLPLALLMLDIDGLKPINDRLGHLVGDEVLRRVGRTLADNVRGGDCLARYGGDELAVVMPETDMAVAHTVAARLCRVVAESEFGSGLRMTVSIGVAGLLPADTDGAALIARADAALYAAKRAGRNRVEAARAA